MGLNYKQTGLPGLVYLVGDWQKTLCKYIHTIRSHGYLAATDWNVTG